MQLRPFLQERSLLQLCIIVGGFIPISAGLAGIFLGPDVLNAAVSTEFDSHFRYLSGLLFGVGLGFWSTVPHIEARGARFKLLGLIVFVGGCARLISLIAVGRPSAGMLGALTMELVVTPLLCWWQYRLSAKLGS